MVELGFGAGLDTNGGARRLVTVRIFGENAVFALSCLQLKRLVFNAYQCMPEYK